METPMSISSLLSEDDGMPTSLVQCTVQAPGAVSDARQKYMAEQLQRFQQLEHWDTQRAAEASQVWRHSFGQRWARSAEVAAVQAYKDLEPRAQSRFSKHDKEKKVRPVPTKRKLEEDPAADSPSASTAKAPRVAAGGRNRVPASEKQYQTVYDGIWRDIARKEIFKAYKLQQAMLLACQTNDKKTAMLAAKESRKWQSRTNKHLKDMQSKARRAMREMMTYWKKSEKEERSQRKAAEKVAHEAAKREEEERESARQARKLNFLITQTELYSHFVSKKEDGTEKDDASNGTRTPNGVTDAKTLDFDDDAAVQAAAEANAQRAVQEARKRASEFGKHVRSIDTTDDSSEMDFQNPTAIGDVHVDQPKLLSCQLKEYQLKGLNWLANLYEQGINGILADEMGLGKTVQSISVMAYLAEAHDIWGPFLVIAPASTLHNWQQEITKFVPEFKVLPYWGNGKDRKVLRKFWDRKQLRYTRDSPFHVLVTSYQLVVADAQYLNRIKWQYMILDEAQAIKSSSSSRWKSLLTMQCRNRLLLTGTPIQNSMQELWALLHFIMPTLFDSHEEFSDWFSKDIESHATQNSQLNEQQLKRLHMILKPFMLRRVKKNVQKELGDKIELDVMCPLSHRQRELYRTIKSKVNFTELEGEDTASLMNLVMQFRKVCNHPDLFERADVKSPYAFGRFGNTSGTIRSVATMLECNYSLRSPIAYELPKLVYRDAPAAREPTHIERLFTVYDPQLESIKAASKLDGTPAGELCRIARRGLFERASGTYELNFEPPHRDVEIEPLVTIMEKAFYEPVVAAPASLVCSDRSHYMHEERTTFPKELSALRRMSLDQEWQYAQRGEPFPANNLYPAVRNNISVPSMNKFIMESGKLAELDKLLVELKANGHRVLVYCQMTRMMDLMAEYLSYRRYQFLRLDGSSKLGDRRDLVNDWQTKPELFVFLLSTRAGGLGINLTAADTVIFYDSDWNPTIDSQAMDRAHRLGQTRQVTVYRLLVKGTIEERMRDRAKQKEHVQQVVMEGGKGADFAKPGGKEVASWLLEED